MSSTAAPSTLGGVAAVGHPIVNGIVQVKCAGGGPFQSTTIGDGTWKATLSGATPPCAVEISGGTINGAQNTTPYHSIAPSLDTANITPLTDLTVANLASTATPDTWFAGLTSAALSSIASNDAVNKALINLRTALNGLPPLSNINPITATFAASPGNPSDDMLAALQTAMANTGVSYPTLLNSASSGFSSTAAISLNAALPAAYAGTPSGSSILTVAQFTPTSGAAGTAVVITGTNFNSSAANNTVNFNGVPANVTSATPTQLVVTVPPAATTGTITVAVGGQTATSAIGFTVPVGLAAQYFTKKVAGNVWTWLRTTSGLSSTQTYTRTITDYTNGVAASSEIFSWNTVTTTIHDQIDATTKAWVSKNDSTGTITTELPETFSVGTPFVWLPAMTGQSALNATVAAFNVTRTVPAGIFTDCLQVNVAIPNTMPTQTLTYYLSPTTGTAVEVMLSSSNMIFFTDKLQTYTAN